jgi:methionyl-tRNA synthetase
VDALLAQYHEAMEGVRLKAGLQTAMLISAAGNAYMQDTKPWELAKSAPARCATIVNTIVSLVRLLSAVLEPFMPGFTDKVCAQLALEHGAMPLRFQCGAAGGIPETVPGKGHPIPRPRPIFSVISPEDVERFRAQFAGTQAEAAAGGGAAAAGGGGGVAPAAAAAAAAAAPALKRQAKGEKPAPKPAKVDLSAFPDIARVDLRVGRIVKCWPHPEADKCVARREGRNLHPPPSLPCQASHSSPLFPPPPWPGCGARRLTWARRRCARWRLACGSTTRRRP